MLDNFTRDELEACCASLKAKYGESKAGKRRWLVEVSGGVTPENFEEHVHQGERFRLCCVLLREKMHPALSCAADIVSIVLWREHNMNGLACAMERMSATERTTRRTFLLPTCPGGTPDVDIISTSSIHQSVQHIDFSLKITPKAKKVADESGAL